MERPCPRAVIAAAIALGSACVVGLVGACDVEVPEDTVADGFTFIGRASDGSALAAALSALVKPFEKFKDQV